MAGDVGTEMDEAQVRVGPRGGCGGAVCKILVLG